MGGSHGALPHVLTDNKEVEEVLVGHLVVDQRAGLGVDELVGLVGLEEAVVDALEHYDLGELGPEAGVVATADVLEGLLNLANLIF
jgi:hypothetical protein